MAYLHCHSCNWSQDDFWDFSFRRYGYWYRWKYNPISVFLSFVTTGKHGYWKPRYIVYDNWIYDKWIAEERGWKSNKRHSWYLIWYQFKRMMRKFLTQKYWTYSNFKRATERNGGHWPSCPKCHKRSLDID